VISTGAWLSEVEIFFWGPLKLNLRVGFLSSVLFCVGARVSSSMVPEEEAVVVSFAFPLDILSFTVGVVIGGKTLMHSSVSESMSGLYTRGFFPADLEEALGLDGLLEVFGLLLGEGWIVVED
jgi:hypothetical protein